EMAAAHPGRVRALVLSSTPFTDEAFRRVRAERPPIDETPPSGDGSHLAALWQKRAPYYPAGRPDLLEAFVLDALKASGGVEQGHRAVASYRMEERIGVIRQPTLVLRADQDPFAEAHAAELASRIQDARMGTIAGGMVPLPDQMPAEFTRAALDFLDGL
ncbi:MAG TPA: alpha/beta hydrolase, partial [Lautropia sp.]|nr:alpha/beta hydrolase [Lautropia sp.]